MFAGSTFFDILSLFETFLSCFEDKLKTSCNFLFARTYVILIFVSSRRVTTEYVFCKAEPVPKYFGIASAFLSCHQLTR